MNFEKIEDCNLVYIAYFINGLLLFYYINSIRNCECVNKRYIDIIQKCFIVNVILFIIRCNTKDNEVVLKYLLFIIILIEIYYIYNIRLLINDIYKKNCECVDTELTVII